MRFLLIGGFLGAGKTTTLLELARRYTEPGLRVGILTNDQADNLVDTQRFRAAGFKTEEIPHGCFCCRFDELVSAAERLEREHAPDIVLAEPVGSCTDLVATVINPLKSLYGDRFTVAPYMALLDPERAYQALAATGPRAFSAKVTYVFQMQQHEADLVAINKIDTLTEERHQELGELVRLNFPKADVIGISAKTGQGLDELATMLRTRERSPVKPPDVDYDTYAEGEAELGWVNASWDVSAKEAFDGAHMLVAVLQSIGKKLLDETAEPAHVKASLVDGERIATAHLVASDRAPDISSGAGLAFNTAMLTVNARVQTSPDALRTVVERAVADACRDHNAQCINRSLDALSPSRPVPTHRQP